MTFEEWYAEQSKPSRQRNLTPEERKELADDLRDYRAYRGGKPTKWGYRVNRRTPIREPEQDG
ncbi:MAG TPA: hypothetical protein VEY95_06345 [Azospirillaceae bacterium]|nr:hypothetical protein [Azospirillaceae bacterium]